MSILLTLLSGPLITAIMSVIGKHYDLQTNRDKLQADLEKAVLGTITHVADTQADIIKAEINSDDRLVRIWRPIASLSLVFVLLFYSLITPVAHSWFGLPPVKVGDLLLSWIYTLCASVLGATMAASSLETIVKMIMSRRK